MLGLLGKRLAIIYKEHVISQSFCVFFLYFTAFLKISIYISAILGFKFSEILARKILKFDLSSLLC